MKIVTQKMLAGQGSRRFAAQIRLLYCISAAPTPRRLTRGHSLDVAEGRLCLACSVGEGVGEMPARLLAGPRAARPSVTRYGLVRDPSPHGLCAAIPELPPPRRRQGEVPFDLGRRGRLAP